MLPEPIAVTLQVTKIFGELDIAYVIGGSILPERQIANSIANYG
jgi:hypothetical protein